MTDLAAVLRDQWPRAVGAVVRLSGDIELAEDAAQEACVVALERWPVDGVPESPGAWLAATARHKALDIMRREHRRADKEQRADLTVVSAVEGAAAGAAAAPLAGDDRLCLMFMCCHPALAPEARLAITLRVVAGVASDDIAALFLVPPATLAQRLVRAKRKIRDAGIPFRVPSTAELPHRLPDVLQVILLAFTQSQRVRDRRDALAREAIRLARLLHELLPGDPETAGLLALLLLVHGRQGARYDDDGRLVLLADQDRSRWDRAEIAEGERILDTALQARRPGNYQIQAALAALHSTAPTAAETDWRQIALLYDELLRRAPSPVVEANRAVAVAMSEGPAAGLVILDVVAGDDRLARWPQLHIARADLLARLGRDPEAIAAYEQALALEPPEPERRFVTDRLHALRAKGKAGRTT